VRYTKTAPLAKPFLRALQSAFSRRRDRRVRPRVEGLEDRVTPVFVGFMTGSSLIDPEGTSPGDGGKVNVYVELSEPAPTPISVQFQTKDGSASGLSDYSPQMGMVMIPQGAEYWPIEFTSVADSLDEGNETFDVELTDAMGAKVNEGAKWHRVEIVDDDKAGTVPDQVKIYLDSDTYTVGEADGKVSVVVRVNRLLNPGEIVTADYITYNGSATETEDYEPKWGTVRFDSSSSNQIVEVPIIDDKADEGDENFTFLLYNPRGAKIESPDPEKSPDTATITIQDNDDPPDPTKEARVQFSAPTAETIEGSSAVLTVTRTGKTDSKVTVTYATTDESAVSPADYQGVTSGQVTFLSGETSKTVSIATVDDSEKEVVEHFRVTLTGATADKGTATLGTPSQAVVAILDNDIKTSVTPEPEACCTCCTTPCACCPHDSSSTISNTSQSQGRNPENRSADPVRYRDGTVSFTRNDLTSVILDAPWGHSRSWTNNVAYLARGVQGNGWVTGHLPYMVQVGTTFVVVNNGTVAHVFDFNGTQYVGRYYDPTKMLYDAVAAEYVLVDTAGNQTRFLDFAAGRPPIARGAFNGYRAASGNLMGVTVRSPLDGRVLEVQQQGVVNGQTVSEAFQYAYVGSGVNAGLLRAVSLYRKVGTGNWEPVQGARYSYYDPGWANGRPGDLKSAAVVDQAGRSLGMEYYRYWTADGPSGYRSALKYVFTADSYARLAHDVPNPDGASDSTVAPYADNYFEFDAQRRVKTEVVQGDDSYTFAYTDKVPVPTGHNEWATKTVETLPDGSIRTVYTNAYAQVMLTARKASPTATDEWVSFNRYDNSGRLLWTAFPSAFQLSGGKFYDDTNADLLSLAGGNSPFLKDGDGLIASYVYGASTTAGPSTPGDVIGFWKSESVKRGELGTAVKQAEWTYFSRTANGVTVYPVASTTRFRNSNGSGGQTTNHAYTYHTNSTRVLDETITYPTVTTGQNGSGTATTEVIVYDPFGRPVWSKDADGFISYLEYDPKTGAVVKSIADVDTTETGDFIGLPTGWSTPSGGGLHLKTQIEVDHLGRPTKITYPNGRVDYTVYDDVNREMRTYAGWIAAIERPTGPTVVVRHDAAAGYSEVLAMTAAPVVSGGRPTGTEPIAGVVGLSRTFVDDGGELTHQDAYFSLNGLPYAPIADLGTENVHFYRTRFESDHNEQLVRTQTPAGTIVRTVYDFLGRPVSEWVGTNDTPPSGEWSPTNNGAPANMVKAREYEYDSGAIGNSNPTKVTDIPGGTAPNRVAQTWFDWRDRPVAAKAGVETTEGTAVNRPLVYTDLDNLGQPVMVRQYDGDTVVHSDGDNDGVPDAPAASLLRAQSQGHFDELGRVYRTEVNHVDPANGNVASNSLKSDVWYNRRGLSVKTTGPGGLVAKTAYNGVGWPTATYLSDGGGDAAYADADDVDGDIVLEQAEPTYDESGNVLLVTSRQRFHDATGTGPLGTISSGVLARVSYTANYFDDGDRPTAAVDVGTNGGTAWTRPATVPERSDTVLVVSQLYDAAGYVAAVADPKGILSRTERDLLGRTVRTIGNYVDGVVSDADDQTVEYEHGPAGLKKLRVRLPNSDEQTTEYVFGVSKAAGDGVDSNDLVKETLYPDASTGLPSTSEKVSVKVNALGETLVVTDRNGNEHTLRYDVVGRPVSDAVTKLGTGVDSAVQRIETAYDGQGNAHLITSFNAASGGAVVNQVKRDFDGLGQLTSEWQEHDGAVTGSSLRVQYGNSFAPSGTTNHSRPTSVTYPNGRQVTLAYSGLDETISRLSALTEGATTLEGYAYLGLGTVVERKHPVPGLDLTYIRQVPEPNGEAGDPYRGLDRFGRVADHRWRDTSDGTYRDWYEYDYDRNSNRIARTNVIDSAFDETYGYDGLDQLTSFQRGSLQKGWDYDAAGNWESVSTNMMPESRTHNRQNELTAVGLASPTYDANGNQTTDLASRAFTYDAWNRVKSAAGKTYELDGLGRRIEETSGGTTTDFYHTAAWQVVEERVDGTPRRQYVWSPVYVDALVLSDRDADSNGTLEERLWVAQDANYNVTAVFDNSGNVVERYVYDPYGSVTIYDAAYANTRASSDVAWTHLFQGLAWDPATGKYHARNRDYDPVQGRWTSNDPIGFAAGDVNLYRFVGNGPVDGLDPLGLQDPWDHSPVADMQRTWGPGGSSSKRGAMTEQRLLQLYGMAREELRCCGKGLYGTAKAGFGDPAFRTGQFMWDLPQSFDPAYQPTNDAFRRYLNQQMPWHEAWGSISSDAAGTMLGTGSPFASGFLKSGIRSVPHGLTRTEFYDASALLRSQVGSISDDIVVQGSRAGGKVKPPPESDIDFAVRVSPEKFDDMVKARFGKPNPGSAKERTMLHACETGKITSGRAGLRPLTKDLKELLNKDVHLSVIRQGGPFDNPPFIQLPKK
jgi:RHS repeat-associated protein